MALTKQYIVEKSIEILNRDGLEGLTMRLLAKELNIKAASLYWHFSDKAELYAAISETLCGRIIMPAELSCPAAYLSDIFCQFRDILISVRDSVAVFENSVPFTTIRMEIIKSVSNALTALGVKPENLATVSNLFNNYVLSFVADEFRFKMSTDEMAALIEKTPPHERLIFSMPRDFDRQFKYGLRLLLEGLERVKDD